MGTTLTSKQDVIKQAYYAKLKERLRLQCECAKAMVKYQTRIIKP